MLPSRLNIDFTIYIAVITILLSRIILWSFWDTSVMYSQKLDSWHHAYTGLILLALGFFIAKQTRLRQVVIGVGMGLIIDEIIIIPCMLGIISPVDYWSATSWVATLIGVLAYALFHRVRIKKD